jgi:hypothetical protein
MSPLRVSTALTSFFALVSVSRAEQAMFAATASGLSQVAVEDPNAGLSTFLVTSVILGVVALVAILWQVARTPNVRSKEAVLVNVAVATKPVQRRGDKPSEAESGDSRNIADDLAGIGAAPGHGAL